MVIDDIEIFSVVAKFGSFSKASRFLEIPKSTISLRIKKLEERLGVRLLQRNNKTVNLTPVGEEYFKRFCFCILTQTSTPSDTNHKKLHPLLRLEAPFQKSEIHVFGKV